MLRLFEKKLRAAGDVTPVIILTAKDQVSDRIAGLNAGADDYLIKPFDLSELSARVSAVARRYRGNPNPLLQIDDLEVDLGDHRVSRNGQQLELTAREWALFEGFFYSAPAYCYRGLNWKIVCINLAQKLRAIPSRCISAVCAKNWDAMLLSLLEVWVTGWRHMSTKTSLQKTLGISLTYWDYCAVAAWRCSRRTGCAV